MRNQDDLKFLHPVDFSPTYILWCAKGHIKELKLQHAACMERASLLDDEITRFKQYVAQLEEGEKK